MKIICEKNELHKKVSIVTKAVAVKSPVYLLEGVYIKAEKDRIVLYGSDGSLYIRCSMEANVLEGGELVLPARLFDEILSKFEDCEISIVSEGNNLVMQCGRSVTTLCFMDAAEYPAFPEYLSNKSAAVLSNQLTSMIDQTAFSVSISEDKPILTGILLEIEGDSAKLVALDGYRLALRKEKIQSESAPGEVVVPSRSMREIARILPAEEQTIKLYYSGSLVAAVCGDIEIAARVLQGDYVKYKNILPSEHITRVVVKKQKLQDSLERASILARQSKANLVRLKIEENMMTITSDSEIGKAKEELEINLFGKTLDISFNSRYLLDVLKEVYDEEIVMDMNTNISPCMIKPVSGDSYLYLVLPVKTGNA
jgi:DNA polymerase III subunit beta